MRIIGSRFSPEAMALRTFASRNRLAHSWIDLEEADDVEVLLASMGLRPVDTPVVVTSTAVLRHPTPGEFASLLGLTYRPIPGRIFDLVVVGVGPAGLAASVYGASEGLDTVSLDAVGPGGPGRLQLAHRELRRVPQRDLRRGPGGAERPSRPNDWGHGWSARARSRGSGSRTGSTSSP